MNISQRVVFKGKVSDFNSLLKAVEFALSFARSSNSTFVRDAPDKEVLMDFTVYSDGSSECDLKPLEETITSHR